jgi:hypothetical protein
VAWAAAVVFVAGAYRVIGAGGRRGTGLEPGSVYNESKQGASLAFRYLQERARAGRAAPRVLSQRLGPGRLPQDGVLLRLAPTNVPAVLALREEKGGASKSKPAPVPLLAPAELTWVSGGGRLVLALRSDYGPVSVRAGGASGSVRKVFPIWPRVTTLAPDVPPRGLAGPPVDDAQTLFASGTARLAARLPLGRGDVLLLSAPELLANERLGQADHLRLLEALAPPERPVAFDEWAHGLGQEEGLLRLLFAWGFGPALLTGALAFGLAIWRSRARLGPEEDDAPEARSEAVDLVESLSELYDRALSRRDAAALDLEGFRRAVALRTGRKGAALERHVRELVARPLPPLKATGEITGAELARRLETLNDAYRRLQEHAHTRRRA